MLTLCHNYFQVTQNTKNGKESTEPFKKRRFVFGLVMLLLVDILWVASSELTKYIYTEKKLERPFLVTYVRSSMLFVYLLVLCFKPTTRDACRPAPDYTQLLEPSTETEDENYFSESTNSLGDSTFVPVRAGETTDSDDAAPRAVRFNKVAEVRVMSAAMAGEALLARLSWAASVRAGEHAQRRAAVAATRRHVRQAIALALPWFIANYLYRLSLLNTSTSSATIYTSISSAFIVSLCAVFTQIPSDRFNLIKCISILMTAAGLVGVGASESHHNSWVGVMSALAAALFYAIHIMMLRHELRKGEPINWPLLAGLVGCACGGAAWAVGGALSAGGVESAHVPAPRLWLWLLADAALGPALAEALWLWGCSLTSMRVGTASLGLVMPLSLCVEVYRGQEGAAAAGRWAGAVLAAAGWGAAVAGGEAAVGGWLRARLCRGQGFMPLRNIPDLDEQSEALISSEEPT